VADKNFKVKTGLDLPQPLSETQGGTGQSSLTNALNAMLPAQAGNSGKILSSDGTNTTWLAQNVAYQRGNTASRPVSPTAGDLYFNSELNYFESYTANGWFPIAAAPTVPTSVIATDTPSGREFNNGRASVAFSIGTNGGAPTSLVVTPTPATSPTTFTGSSSPIIVTGLSSSTQYTYTAYATSPYGTSAASSASSGVTATSVPQAPTIGAVTAGNATATVAYTTNATGGSAITTFTATSNPGGLTGTGTSPISVSGLTNGTSYTFAVTATNANGTSAASTASSAVSPSAFTPESAYDALASVTLSAPASSITFAGIPSGYKHLEIRGIGRHTSTGLGYQDLIMQFNGDSSSIYSRHNIGVYSPTSTTRATDVNASSSQTFIRGWAQITSANASSNTFGAFLGTVLDYSSTTKYKTLRSLTGMEDNSNTTENNLYFASGSWQSTSAVTSITIAPFSAVNFGQYTQVALYGVK